MEDGERAVIYKAENSKCPHSSGIAMDDNDNPQPSSRSTLLIILLGALAGVGVFVFFVALMGMFFLSALAMVAGIAVLGCLHYLLWGRSFSQQVAGEREEGKNPAEADDWPVNDPYGPRRF